MENTKGKKRNFRKKSGGPEKACKFQPVQGKDKHSAARMQRSTGTETKRKRSTKGDKSAAGEPSMERSSGMAIKRKKSVKGDKASGPQEMAEANKRIRLRKKTPIPPLPVHLPPVNLLRRDVLRAWCQQLRLSTSGMKVETYMRLREHAYPNQKDIPVPQKETKILSPLQRRLKMEKGEMTLDSFGLSEMPAPLEGGSAPAGDATALLKGMDNMFVTTSTPDAVFASWSKIAASTGKMKSRNMETVASPQEASGYKWCVVHGQSLPADTEGWVRLQFYAGQPWVPEKQGQVCALFLLPACSFPPPHLEDNMVCPKCIHRNKVLMRSLQ